MSTKKILPINSDYDNTEIIDVSKVNVNKDGSDYLEFISNTVATKTESYDPSKDDEEVGNFNESGTVTYRALAFRYAHFKDYQYLFFGFITCSCFAAALPGFCLLWGDLFDNVGGGIEQFDNLGKSSINMVYLGAFTLFMAGF
jgi:hypothetical protein